MVASILPFIPNLGHIEPSYRVMTLFLGFSVCFVILSISVEGLFYCSYTATLAVWTEVETVLHQYAVMRREKNPGAQELPLENMRIAVFFLFFVQVAFFGAGK